MRFLLLALISVSLTWGQESLVPTVVTGTAIEENADLAAVQVRVITAQEWEGRGALTVRDALEMMAGFRSSVHPATPDFAQSSLQGLPGAYIKVLLDGVEITGDIAGATPLEQIGLAGIERIEIVEGASSVLYGSDAMGGVIHLITARSSKPQSWSGDVRAGLASTKETFGHVALQGRKQNLQSSLEAQFSNDPGTQQSVRNIYGDPIELFPMPPTQQESARYRIDWKDGRKKVGVSTHVRYQDRRLRDATLFESWYKDLGYGVDLHGNWPTTAASDLEFVLAGQGFHHVQEQKNLQFGNELSPLQTDLKSWDGEGKWHYRESPQRVWLFGVQGKHSTLGGTDFKKEMSEQDADVYTQALLSFGAKDQWLLSPGVRWSGILTPRLGIRYGQDSLWIYRITYGMGYREPTLKERYWEFYHQAPYNFFLKGNANLKPERSHSFTMSAEKKQGDWRVQGSLYANYLEDLITDQVVDSAPGQWVQEDGTSLPYIHVRSYANVDRARTLGADLQLSWMPTYGVLDVAYSRLWMREILFQSAHQIRLSGRWDTWWPKVQWGSELQWNSPQLKSRKPWDESPDYWMLDLHSRIQVNQRLAFTLHVDNVLDNANDGQTAYYGLYHGRTWKLEVQLKETNQ